jgi:hypothetical protein
VNFPLSQACLRKPSNQQRCMPSTNYDIFGHQNTSTHDSSLFLFSNRSK